MAGAMASLRGEAPLVRLRLRIHDPPLALRRPPGPSPSPAPGPPLPHSPSSNTYAPSPSTHTHHAGTTGSPAPRTALPASSAFRDSYPAAAAAAACHPAHQSGGVSSSHHSPATTSAPPPAAPPTPQPSLPPGSSQEPASLLTAGSAKAKSLLSKIGICRRPALNTGSDDEPEEGSGTMVQPTYHLKYVSVGIEIAGGINLSITSPYRKSRRMPSHEAITMVASKLKLQHAAPPADMGPPLPGRVSWAGPGGGDAEEEEESEGLSEGEGEGEGQEGLGAGLKLDRATEKRRKEAWAVYGERLQQKAARVKAEAPLGHLPGWAMRCVIVKSGDDCRQELLAVQLIHTFDDIFQEASLPLWLRPYNVLVTSNRTAMIEVVPDALSIHTVKHRSLSGASLSDHFFAKWPRGTPECLTAQRNFTESLAAYSIVCYFLQIKDRHNGNVLIDDQGHIVHIDFGFMLSNSPGPTAQHLLHPLNSTSPDIAAAMHLYPGFRPELPGSRTPSSASTGNTASLGSQPDRCASTSTSAADPAAGLLGPGCWPAGGVNFEAAPFKLTRELLEVMDSNSEGQPSELFDYFKVLIIQGFLACRKHHDRLLLLVRMMSKSGLPCFKAGDRAVKAMEKRFALQLTEVQSVQMVLGLISDSLDAWRTRQYDYYQRLLNGIFALMFLQFYTREVAVLHVNAFRASADSVSVCSRSTFAEGDLMKFELSRSSLGNLIPELDESTWRTWRMRVEGLLVEASLWDIVETGVTALPPAPAATASAEARAAYAAAQTTHRAELVSDAKAKALIKRCVSNPYLQLVHDSASAKEAWDELDGEFTQTSVARQTQLQQQLSMMRMQPGETVAQFFSRIYQLKSDLEACNCSISESTIVLTVIANLSPDYKPSTQQLRYEQTGPTGLSLSRVKRVMQFREADLLLDQQQEHYSSPSSLFAFSSSSSRGAGSSGLVHMDVCGPIYPAARDGSLYLATFLDEFTRISVVMPLRSKAQVPDIVKQVIEQLETQSGQRCKAIRTDNGTEYVNKQMQQYCSDKGIIHQHSAPYSPEQNGAAERLNRTIMEKTRSILHAGRMGLQYWADAAKLSNYVRCVLPVTDQPLTPWESFFGVKPDLSGLRVFGSDVWVHVPAQKRSKLEAKAVRGVFVGYQLGSKSYKILVAGREYHSKDVIFDEQLIQDLPTRPATQQLQFPGVQKYPPLPAHAGLLVPVAPPGGDTHQQQQQQQPTVSSDSRDSGTVPAVPTVPAVATVMTATAELKSDRAFAVSPQALLEPNEIIYVQQPEGFVEGSYNTVCKLQKALYGLRQAPRAWHARLKQVLEGMGFRASESDPALFTMQRQAGMVYLLVYVDDCLICTEKGDFDSLNYVKQQLSAVFGIKDLGDTKWFLGMKVTRDRAVGTLKLDQQQYVLELLNTYGMTTAHSKSVPMAPAVKLEKEGVALDTSEHSYSGLVGSLLYLSCCTRPDITYAVGALARYMSAPTQQHWTAARAILSYLKGTADQGLVFGESAELQGYCDADYAGDKDTARSTTGYVFAMNGAAISWSSRLQPTVAMSTAESEYMAASSALVTPDQGVKQGCPISPLLFALYVHDISKEFLGPVDAVRVQGTPVTHFMYADDLTLVSTSPHGLQRLVCQLQGFADRKHLTVNVGKSKVMVFNGNSQTAAPSIGYKHEILPVVREFKYLGMHFNPSATPAFAATHMRAGMFLAMRQACKRAREYGVLHDPYALCHLIRAFVLPLGLYGSQVWGTAFLGHGVQLSNPVQTRMLSFLRFAARVRSSVSGLMVLHELGQLPLQLYWLRAACKFWNTAKLSHSDLLMRVIKADVELGRSCQASWSAQFQLAARELMGGEFTLSPDMVLGTKAMEVKWLERWGRRWVGFEGDPRLPETVHRERCSYVAWFKHGDGIGINHMAPHLLNRQLSTEVRTSLTRFRLGNSGLGVEKARFEGVTFIDRTCTRCTEGVVDDAMHFIFECTATSSIREQPEFALTLQNNNENLHDFMLSPCAPLFVHLAMKCVTESPEPLEGEGGLAA
ncbi:hypothetical protein QJQ45_019158 [Haematococcus lacustris]|nr:hypothetical protein QJQ45_019158 [Haematococcus lacustris]